MYRIVKLAGFDIYRIEVLKPWLFGYWGRPVWKPFHHQRWGYGGDTSWERIEYDTLTKAQEAVTELRLADLERLSRRIDAWRRVS